MHQMIFKYLPSLTRCEAWCLQTSRKLLQLTGLVWSAGARQGSTLSTVAETQRLTLWSSISSSVQSVARSESVKLRVSSSLIVVMNNTHGQKLPLRHLWWWATAQFSVSEPNIWQPGVNYKLIGRSSTLSRTPTPTGETLKKLWETTA